MRSSAIFCIYETILKEGCTFLLDYIQNGEMLKPRKIREREIYIYIYIYRERETEITYIYIYIFSLF